MVSLENRVNYAGLSWSIAYSYQSQQLQGYDSNHRTRHPSSCAQIAANKKPAVAGSFLSTPSQHPVGSSKQWLIIHDLQAASCGLVDGSKLPLLQQEENGEMAPRRVSLSLFMLGLSTISHDVNDELGLVER